MSSFHTRLSVVCPRQFLKHEGKRYCLGVPVDSPMALLDSRGKPIDPSDEVRALGGVQGWRGDV